MLICIKLFLSGPALATDPVYLADGEVASGKGRRWPSLTRRTPGDAQGHWLAGKAPTCPSPRETGPKLPPSTETSLVSSLMASHNAIAR